MRRADRTRAMVFQSPSLFPWMTAEQNVALALEGTHPELSGKERREKARFYLGKVGLEEVAGKRIGELSMGMRQRVNVARAFAMEPELLLLDEPFGMLDSITRSELQEVLLEHWGQSACAGLMVTHDIEEAVYLADRIVVMTDGPEATVGKIFRNPSPRPKDRRQLGEDPVLLALRQEIFELLEGSAGSLRSVSGAEGAQWIFRSSGRPLVKRKWSQRVETTVK